MLWKPFPQLVCIVGSIYLMSSSGKWMRWRSFGLRGIVLRDRSLSLAEDMWQHGVKLGSCVSASSYMRFIWHLCSESRLPYTSIPAFLMVWLQSIPFSPCTRSLLQHFLRHFLVAIDSLLPSEISMEVFKHVTKQGDEPICENNWFVVKIRTMRRYLTDLSIIIC